MQDAAALATVLCWNHSTYFLRHLIYFIDIFHRAISLTAFKKEQKGKESKKKEAAEKRKSNQENTEVDEDKRLKSDDTSQSESAQPETVSGDDGKN